MLRYFFVINPISANGKALKLWTKFEPKLKKAFPNMASAMTKHRGHGISLAREALNSGFNRIIVVGGDGSFNEVANGFMKSNEQFEYMPAMGLIPSGTGDDFARTIKMPKKIDAIIDTLKSDCLVSADVGSLRCKGTDNQDIQRYFLNVASLGMSSKVAETVDKMSKAYGANITYLFGTAKVLRHFKKPKLSIEGFYKGESVFKYENQPQILVAVGNGQYFGGGFKICPGAKIDDGALDFLSIGNLTMAQTIYNVPNLYWGGHKKHPKVSLVPVHQVQATSSDKLVIECDGEVIGFLPMQIEVCPAAIQVIVSKKMLASN